MTPEALKDALRQVKYPGFSRDIVSFGLVNSAVMDGATARVSIAVATTNPEIPGQIQTEAEKVLRSLPGVRDAAVEVAVTAPRPPSAPQPTVTAATAGIRHSVAVASGKGGVGKSTVAVNLACALATGGGPAGSPLRVGLMDCDIYGPSVPLMLGLAGRPQLDGDDILPLEKHGVKVMSIGFLVDDESPIIWRGPMIMKAIQQFVSNVRWGDLDILLIDLPPGTGDAQISLVQTLPLSGVLLVTTPQLAATRVAQRGGMMFRKMNVPLLGVVENMSAYTDSAGVRHALFGEGGGARTAAALGTELIGSVPLLPELRECGDRGDPPAATAPGSPASEIFGEIARSLVMKLSKTRLAV